MTAGVRDPVGAAARRATPAGSRLWAVVAVVVLVAYDTWVWLPVVNGHPAIMNGYLSELSASDQPNNLFFRFGDGLTAVLVAVIGVAALRRWPIAAAALDHPPTTARWWRISAVFLLLFALSTGLDAVTSMDCSPTLSAACRTAEESGTLSWAHYLHTGTSVGAQVGTVGSMVAAVVAERARPVVLRRGLLGAVLGVEVVALTVMMTMLAAGVPGIGYPQAVMVVAAAGWFAVAALAVGRPPRSDRP